jgi:hypothetical protein
MKRVWRDNGLSIVMFSLFVFSFCGQIFAGYLDFNQEQQEHSQETISLGRYLTTGHFTEATFENWESEFLQMSVYVLFTVFLYQKGSAESKSLEEDNDVDQDPRTAPDDPNAPGPVRRGGWMLKVYEYSLTIVFFVLFLLSFVLHGIGGAHEYNAEQMQHGGQAISTLRYFVSAPFWFQSFQNWQSEFLSVGAIVVLSIFLRQRGSPESKPVAMPHGETDKK